MIQCLELDVCSKESILKMVENLKASKIEFDIVINNAGVMGA